MGYGLVQWQDVLNILKFQLNGSLSVNERLVENAAFRLLVDASTQDGDDEEFLLPWISMSYSRDKIVFISVVQGEIFDR